LDGCHGGRRLDYGPGLCPRTEEALRHIVTLGLNENYTRADIEDMAGAIRKVVDGLRAKEVPPVSERRT
jgi:hypothetical protein